MCNSSTDLDRPLLSQTNLHVNQMKVKCYAMKTLGNSMLHFPKQSIWILVRWETVRYSPGFHKQEALGILIFCPESHFTYTLSANEAKACDIPGSLSTHQIFIPVPIAHNAACAMPLARQQGLSFH